MKKSLNSADLGLMSSRVHSECIPPVCIRAKRRRKWSWVLDTLLRWLLPIKFLGAFVTHTPCLYPCNRRDLIHEYAKQPNFTFTSYRSWVSPCQISSLKNLKGKWLYCTNTRSLRVSIPSFVQAWGEAKEKDHQMFKNAQKSSKTRNCLDTLKISIKISNPCFRKNWTS